MRLKSAFLLELLKSENRHAILWPVGGDSHYYLPALHVKGYVDYVGKDSGSLYFSTRDEEQTVLIVNAVDGSVINIINE